MIAVLWSVPAFRFTLPRWVPAPLNEVIVTATLLDSWKGEKQRKEKIGGGARSMCAGKTAQTAAQGNGEREDQLG